MLRHGSMAQCENIKYNRMKIDFPPDNVTPDEYNIAVIFVKIKIYLNIFIIAYIFAQHLFMSHIDIVFNTN